MKKLTLVLTIFMMSTMMWSQYFEAGFSSTHVPAKQYATFLKTYGNIVKAKASTSKVPHEVVLTIMATENKGMTSHPLNNFSKLKPHKKLLVGKFTGSTTKSGLVIFGKSRHCAEVTIDAMELLAKSEASFPASDQDWLLMVYGEGKDLEHSAPAAELAYQSITGKFVKLLPEPETPLAKTAPKTEQSPVEKTEVQSSIESKPVEENPSTSIAENNASNLPVDETNQPDKANQPKVVLPVITEEIPEIQKPDDDVSKVVVQKKEPTFTTSDKRTKPSVTMPETDITVENTIEKEEEVAPPAKAPVIKIVAGAVPPGCHPLKVKYDKKTDAKKLVYGRLLEKGKKRKSGDKGPALDFQLIDNKLFLSYSSNPPKQNLRISKDTPLLVKLTSGEFMKFTINKTEKKVIESSTDNTFHAFAPMSMTQLQKLSKSAIEMVRIADHSMIYVEVPVHEKSAKKLAKDAGCLSEQLSVEKN